MKHWCNSMVVVIACAVGGLSMAQELKRAELRVKVVQQQSRSTVKPFGNVSGFLVRRVNQPYQGARCHEPSDSQGQITCHFVCLNQDESATVNLVPPRTLDGYADSGEVQLELRGCSLSKKEVVVTYRDAAVALREVLDGEALGARFAAIGSASWDPVRFDAVKTDLSAFAGTPVGRAKLGEIRLLADVLARSTQYQDNAAAAAALKSLSIGSANVLLDNVAGKYVDPETRKKIAVSSFKIDFYKNLDTLEFKLQAKPAKTVQDFEALRGIRGLKEEQGQAELKNFRFLIGAPS